MARKATPTRAKSSRQRSLPLGDDPRWRPLEVLHKLLTERLGDPHLAALDLTEALAIGKLHCRMRRMHDGARFLVPVSFWVRHELSDWSDGLRITQRRNQPRAEFVLPDGVIVPAGNKMPDGYAAFSAWERDFDRLWLPTAASTLKPELEIDERRKPGPRINKDWKLHAAGELHRIVIVEKKPPPTADELAKYCHKKTGYLPEISEVSRLIRLLH
jgi:hypothetical protein